MTAVSIVLRDGNPGGIRPDFALDITPERRQVETPAGAGAVFTRQINERKRRRWQFRWDDAPEGQRHILEAKWTASKGGVLPMSYLTEDGTETVAVRFMPDSLRITQTGPATYSMTVEAEEDLSSGTELPSGDLNVIVFLIDDAGREYYEAYDNATWTGDPIPSWLANQWGVGGHDPFDYPPTPVLNNLAANGLLLSRMNTAAMCSPTRASLLTGRHNVQHTLGNAIQGTDVPAFRLYGQTIYQLLQDQGSNYERIHIGKMHCLESYSHYINGAALGAANTEVAFRGPVERAGATYYQGGLMNFGTACPGYETGNTPYDQEHSNFVEGRHDARDNPRFDPAFRIKAADGSNALYRETKDAIRLIQNCEEDGKPFIMHVWYHAVHDPSGWDNIGGAYLSGLGWHSYGASNPGGAISGDTSHPGIVKAFVESVDTSMGQILDALSADQASRTMVVFLTDNGSTSDMLTPNTDVDVTPGGSGGDVVPTSIYDASHSKRSPWQGGIGAGCVIYGPMVVDPGDGTAPRVWDGLCGVEDVFRLTAEWCGAFVPDVDDYQQDILRAAVRNTSDAGRDVYIQRAFQNGYFADMWSSSQSGIRFISGQTSDGWKLLMGTTGSGPVGDLTTEWQLYKMTDDPTELTDIFAAARTALGGSPTVQQVYDSMTLAQRRHFDIVYNEIEAEGQVPPGMAVEVST